MKLSTDRAAGDFREGHLVRRLLLASSAVFLLGMAIVGAWLSSRITEDVKHNTAVATALYFESFVAPLLQDLGAGPISEAKRAKLDALVAGTPLAKRVLSFKIWVRGGKVLYATRPELIGRTFPPTPSLKEAWRGQVTAELESVEEEESAGERASGMPLLEIYVPIRRAQSDEIIAVAEFYEKAQTLKDDILRTQISSWLIIGAIAIAAITAFTVIVLRASRTIDAQRRALRDRIGELSALLTQNETLRTRLERSSARVVSMNERYLRQLGAELHDGPAQLVGLALLRLDAIRAPRDAAETASCQNTEIMRAALKDTLAELRNLSAGLALPELEHLSLAETIREAVRLHEQRTGTPVSTDIASLPESSEPALRTTVFRLVQEGLNNALRHAEGAGQSVRAGLSGSSIFVEVSDEGPGIATERTSGRKHLGLSGLKDRIEILGGSLDVISAPGQGTRLVASIPIASGASNHA